MSSRMSIHVHTKSLLMWSDYAILLRVCPLANRPSPLPRRRGYARLTRTISTTVYILKVFGEGE